MNNLQFKLKICQSKLSGCVGFNGLGFKASFGVWYTYLKKNRIPPNALYDHNSTRNREQPTAGTLESTRLALTSFRLLQPGDSIPLDYGPQLQTLNPIYTLRIEGGPSIFLQVLHAARVSIPLPKSIGAY